MPNNSIWSLDGTLSGVTILSQSGSNGNEGVLYIPQRLFSITSKTNIGGGSYLCTEMQLVYSTAPTDWAGFNMTAKIDNTQQNCKRRFCGDRDETIDHVRSECSKLAQKEYKSRYDSVGKVIDWELCKKLKFDHTDK